LTLAPTKSIEFVHTEPPPIDSAAKDHSLTPDP
jgi:hypothetical protein